MSLVSLSSTSTAGSIRLKAPWSGLLLGVAVAIASSFFYVVDGPYEVSELVIFTVTTVVGSTVVGLVLTWSAHERQNLDGVYADALSLLSETVLKNEPPSVTAEDLSFINALLLETEPQVGKGIRENPIHPYIWLGFDVGGGIPLGPNPYWLNVPSARIRSGPAFTSIIARVAERDPALAETLAAKEADHAERLALTRRAVDVVELAEAKLRAHDDFERSSQLAAIRTQARQLRSGSESGSDE